MELNLLLKIILKAIPVRQKNRKYLQWDYLFYTLNRSIFIILFIPIYLSNQFFCYPSGFGIRSHIVFIGGLL